MNFAPLTDRVRLQQVTRTQDAHGQDLETWTTIKKRWAEITPVSGGEVWRADQVQATSVYDIRLRAAPELTVGDWRILDADGGVYHPIYLTHSATETVARCKAEA
jgi:SPP1 family predicted phage head-tail adaptor